MTYINTNTGFLWEADEIKNVCKMIYESEPDIYEKYENLDDYISVCMKAFEEDVNHVAI